MSVPLWAERHATTSWHPGHIAERYGLFTLIVLGESISAATVAIQGSLDHEVFSLHLAALIASALVIVFAMWWLYFHRPVHHLLKSSKVGFWWGYGHLVIFASTAAVGAGISVVASAGHGAVSREAACAVAIPVAIYVVSVWLIHIRPVTQHRAVTPGFLLTAGLVLAAPLTPWPLALIAALLAALVALLVVTSPAEVEEPESMETME
jgi:low temperature requirement protein LtrA